MPSVKGPSPGTESPRFSLEKVGVAEKCVPNLPKENKRRKDKINQTKYQNVFWQSFSQFLTFRFHFILILSNRKVGILIGHGNL